MKRLIGLILLIFALGALAIPASVSAHQAHRTVLKPDFFGGAWHGSAFVPICGNHAIPKIGEACNGSGWIFNSEIVPMNNQIHVCYQFAFTIFGPWHTQGCEWHPSSPHVSDITSGESKVFHLAEGGWYRTFMFSKVEHDGTWYSGTRTSVAIHVGKTF